MSEILGLLKEIRMSPSVYLGRESISRFAAFLDGYYEAIAKTGPRVEPIIRGFYHWVRSRYRIRSEHRWDEIILFFECEEKRAFLKAFELLGEYRAEIAKSGDSDPGGIVGLRHGPSAQLSSNEIIDLIAKIRRQPGIYIGRESITRLASYLDGYCFGIERVKPRTEFFCEFEAWVLAEFDMQESHRWEDLFLFYYRDETYASRRFFTIFDEFITHRQAGLTQD